MFIDETSDLQMTSSTSFLSSHNFKVDIQKQYSSIFDNCLSIFIESLTINNGKILRTKYLQHKKIKYVKKLPHVNAC